MKTRLLLVFLLICIFVGIGSGLLYNLLKPEKIDVRSMIGSFPKEGRLEVLSASVEINTSILKGEKNDTDYFSIYSTPGTAVYSVDLEEIQIDFLETNNKILIGIPTPDFVLYIAEDDGEKVFEFQKHSYTGNAQSGYESFIESRSISYNNAVKSIKNNRELTDMAKESAKTQVTNLTLSMTPNGYNVTTYFLE